MLQLLYTYRAKGIDITLNITPPDKKKHFNVHMTIILSISVVLSHSGVSVVSVKTFFSDFDVIYNTL